MISILVVNAALLNDFNFSDNFDRFSPLSFPLDA